MSTAWKQTVSGIAYLGISYTGKHGPNCPRYMREGSFQMANAVAARLMEDGEIVFSPISHSHPISDFMVDFVHEHDFWMQYNVRMMEMCNRIYVIKTREWKRSRGLRFEIQWFMDHNYPVFILDINRDTGEITKDSYHLLQVRKPEIIVEQLKIFNPDIYGGY